ncbi:MULTISPECIES: histidinol dehydrogenase [unclassified Lentimicrobium]|uniref:histidinol dehydrogenase n=1 Tax=unclassified Lentimicrobium TaxID=2677434 RepID=UPI001C12FFBB|nr:MULTISPECIES: histidinol dehydrogenase [unclassified Lentimicrobium]
MNIIKNSKEMDWPLLMQRPQIETRKLSELVYSIFEEVKKNGDSALKNYALQFEKAELNSLQVSNVEFEQAEGLVPQALKDAIDIAKANIEKFHTSQKVTEEIIETSLGVKCWRKSLAIEKVGLYIPGGTAPLFSTILMLGIPAQIAACKEIIMCTPCDENGLINPAVLYTAQLIGINKVYKVGGAQAIAAMAFGTETITPVYKIFGPGNQYVTKAKELVQQMGIAIDMPAGPSEVLVIADETSLPQFIAADLLSQAEHGSDSQVILLSDQESVLEEAMMAISEQIKELPRAEIAKQALENSKFILLENMSDCFRFSNQYAPEHLIIASEKANDYVEKVMNAGSVFLGNYSCESAGDYASGTNHTLPTNGFARNYSGVSLDSFMKKITFQELSKAGISNLGKTIEVMAEAEGLMAHKNAVSIRLKEIENV